MNWKRILKLPAFLAANLAVLLLVGVSTVRESYRNWSVDREIRALDAQASTLEGHKLKLMELKDKLSSPDTVELEARSRLGWKKDGERVFVLSGYRATTDTVIGYGTDEFAVLPPETGPHSNPERWMHYFFNSN